VDREDPRLTRIARLARQAAGRLRRDDRGSSVIAAAIAFTIILPLLAACFQAALWFAARDAALSAAQQGVQAARAENATLGAGLAAACAYARTAAAGILRGASCTGSTGNTVTVTVTGHAPSLVPLFPAAVTEQAQGPRERFTTRTLP
jgi:Flp pilus assembly protein TadG